jgi:endonuclease/exonuclease/phosphatase family metal-dependent hydrolase
MADLLMFPGVLSPFMKRRTFLTSLGLAGLGSSLSIISRAAEINRGSVNSRTIRVLSCNVRVDVPEDAKGGDGWAQRRRFCLEVIQARKPHLIGLQEAQLAHFEYLKREMPEYETFGLYNLGKQPFPLNAIFFAKAKFELVTSGGFWFSKTPHVEGSTSWDSPRPRFVNWVHLRDRQTGGELRYWNTHLDHLGQESREHSAAMIVEASKALAQTTPQILSGDMNAGFSNPAIKMFLEGGWLDTYGAMHGPKEPGFTAHGFKGAQAPATRQDGSIREKIDWVFVRGRVKTTGAEIIRDSRDGRYPSDHYFVSADLSL